MKRCCLFYCLLLIAQFAIADSDCTQFGFCSVCTFTDDFTDEVSTHELRCGSKPSDIDGILRQGLVNIGCFPNDDAHFAVFSKFHGDKLHSQNVTVRYRFDDKEAYIGEWLVYNHSNYEESMALSRLSEDAADIATGIHNSERLLYEVDDVRSQISFSQPDAQNAVKEIERRCEGNE